MSNELLQSLGAIIKAKMVRVDYLALYPCRIVKQNADFTLELKPDSESVPGFSKVPIAYGTSGVAVKVTGGRCLLGFRDGDPRQPFACHFDSDGVQTLYFGGQQSNGSDVTQFAAIAEKVQQALDDIKAAFNSHTHAVATTGSATAQSGTAAPVTSPIATLGPVAAQNVKVK